MDPLILHRFSIKPGHLEEWRVLWQELVELRRAHGFTTHRAFLETQAEPKLTWLYSHPDPAAGEEEMRGDPGVVKVTEQLAPHVFRNVKVRPVTPEILTEGVTDKLAIMRRYSIVGSWPEFLSIWRRIVPVREKHGFRCLFAVGDQPENMFTWAFDFDGVWEDFPAAQRDYYRDHARVELREVFHYMADYAITPAGQLPIPGLGQRPLASCPRSRCSTARTP